MSVAIVYRRFFRAYNAFHRVMPWLWIAGCISCVAVALLQLGNRWMLAVCLVTIYPALVGWLGFNGIGTVLKVVLRADRVSRTHRVLLWTLLLALMILGLVFVTSAAWIVFSLIRYLAG